MNAAPALTAAGHSASFAPASDSTVVKMTKLTGSFGVTAGPPPPSVTMQLVAAPGSGVDGPVAWPEGLAWLVAS